MISTTKREMKWKNGTIWPAKVKVNVVFEHNKVAVTYDGNTFRTRLFSLHKYLTGFMKTPSYETVCRWSDNGYAKTITGKKVEPDGYGPDGSPSWLIVFGII